MRSSLLWIWFAVFLILQGCVHATVQPNQISKAHTTELKQRYYQVKTKASAPRNAPALAAPLSIPGQ